MYLRISKKIFNFTYFWFEKINIEKNCSIHIIKLNTINNIRQYEILNFIHATVDERSWHSTPFAWTKNDVSLSTVASFNCSPNTESALESAISNWNGEPEWGSHKTLKLPVLTFYRYQIEGDVNAVLPSAYRLEACMVKWQNFQILFELAINWLAIQVHVDLYRSLNRLKSITIN